MSETIVIKHGSSTVENESGIGLDQNKINFHVGQHDTLRKLGFKTIEVASGAVVAGRECVIETGRSLDKYDNRALAKLGTARQILQFANAGQIYDILVSQVLATHFEIDDKSEGRQIIRGIREDSENDTLVVLNENNAAASVELDIFNSDEEDKIKGEVVASADNDWMAAHTGIAIGAEAALFLTNKDGFEIDGRVVPIIRTYDIPEMLQHCDGASDSGTGGMNSKLRAAGRAADAGLHVVIGNAFVDNRRVMDGQGTTVIQ